MFPIKFIVVSDTESNPLIGSIKLKKIGLVYLEINILKSVVKFGDAKLISSSINVLHNKINRRK